MEKFKPRRAQGSSLQFWIRKGTTDRKALQEVIDQNTYQKPRKGFTLGLAQNWLDLGGNIGAFALWALIQPEVEQVITVEPEKENATLLEENYYLNCHLFPQKDLQIIEGAVVPADYQQDHISLYLCKGDYNKYRHTIVPKKGRQSIEVPTVTLEELLEAYPQIDGVKIDIEGAEIPILEQLDPKYLKRIKAMVFEYTFDADPSIPRFLQIIERLRPYFKQVHYTKVNPQEKEYKHFPAQTNVYLWK